jgi:hypothetical protein
MAIEPINIVEGKSAVKYDGMNSAEIAALIPDFTVVSEIAGTLTFTSLGVTYTVPTGGWVTYWNGAVRETPFANDDDFFDVYRNANIDEVHVHDLKLTTGPGYVPTEG